MFKMRSKWGVEFTGNPADLENITIKLNNAVIGPDSLFVSKLNDLAVLRTAKWDSASQASDVRLLAVEELAIIRGAIELLDTCGQLDVATIFELADHGAILNQTRVTQIRLRTAKPQNEWAPSSDYQEIANAVQTNEFLRSALSDLTYEIGWHEIYRITEALCRHYGGERYLLNAFLSEAPKIARMKRTANSYRHTEGSFAPVANPMALHDATKLATEVLKQAIKAAQPAQIATAPKQFAIPNYQYDADQHVGLGLLSLDGPSSAGSS